jgi:hypothetical protein
MPIYFSWLITALLSVGGDTNNHNLPQSGRLLYCVTRPATANWELDSPERDCSPRPMAMFDQFVSKSSVEPQANCAALIK